MEVIILKSTETAHKSKKKIIIIACSAILILFIALLLYFRPIYLKFQVPDSQPQDLAVYVSSTNVSGGITADKHQLSVEEFSKIIEILDKTPLQRTFPLGESSLSGYAPFDLKASYTADKRAFAQWESPL